MKTGIYHISLASHNELFFRSDDDYIHAFNFLAEACYINDSQILADSFLPTHLHNCIRSSVPRQVLSDYRNKYSRYFNAKYKRSGRFGDREPFIDQLIGARRITIGLSYVLRQGLHHGLSSTAMGYKHCSVNSYFTDDLGRDEPQEMISNSGRARFLSRNSPIPKEWRMEKSGLLVRKDVIDTDYVESIFVTPRNFLFQMNRITDESWIKEQKTDEKIGIEISLETIEKGMPEFDLEKILRNEKGRMDLRLMSDIELCRIVDTIYVPRYCTDNDYCSVYALPEKTRRRIAEDILEKYRLKKNSIASKNQPYVTVGQVRRCLLL
ncbi:MAG: hypothetical protein MJZ07_04460 [Bacteroidales bacterium]|nr:hypothetical protein [Bacteroidales bacterium]